MTSKQLDKYYTNPDVVDLCLSHINTMDYDIICEPSAGAGNFSDKLVCFAYDLHPDKPDIIKQDFLRLKVTGSIAGKRILFVGNPPYGKSARLAIQFINHAYLLGATDIAFVLPKTMLRYSAQKRVNSDLKLTLSIDLPKNSFSLDGKICDVPSVFQIWSRKGDCNRTAEPTNTHPHFKISSRYNPKATFVIRGVRPVISNEVDVYDRISPNTRYYSVEPLVDGVEEIFRSIDLVSKCKSTGMPCLSIPECVAAYAAVGSDWVFDNKTPNAFIVGASRRVIPIGSITNNHRGYKIHSNIPVDKLSEKFDSIDWVGSSSVSGGVFWLTQQELKEQYE